MSKTVYSIVDDNGTVYADNIVDVDLANEELANITQSLNNEVSLTLATREVEDDARVIGVL